MLSWYLKTYIFLYAYSILYLYISMLDTFRKYFLSGYIIHMSFAASILAASVIFLAGITSALTNDVSAI